LREALRLSLSDPSMTSRLFMTFLPRERQSDAPSHP
jgi:hypothetical protein